MLLKLSVRKTCRIHNINGSVCEKFIQLMQVVFHSIVSTERKLVGPHQKQRQAKKND